MTHHQSRPGRSPAYNTRTAGVVLVVLNTVALIVNGSLVYQAISNLGQGVNWLNIGGAVVAGIGFLFGLKRTAQPNAGGGVTSFFMFALSITAAIGAALQ